MSERFGVEDEGDAVEPETSEAEPVYPNHVAFVEQFLAPVIQRKVNLAPGRGLVFDPEWWRYPEVEQRFMALWLAWEAAVKGEPSAVSSWWLQHCDPHLDRILNGETGPFHLYNPHASFSPVPPGLPITPLPPQVP
ncbi:DUF4913 domain-containing protein [Corynebacterium sp. CCM 9203]|uniref:DUF4913 domain-containing protein n=1 Tax=Corynebacterium sp. CCM 9203 TaxID=3057615 RepID=UPI003525C4A8